MRSLGKGCLELVVIWALSGYGLYNYYSAQFTPPGDLYGAIGAGFLIACGWGSLRNAYLALRQRSVIHRSIAGAPPEDGKVYAVAGKIRALNTPLIAPFTKREAVILGYEFFREYTRTHGTGSNRRTERYKDMFLSGYAMTPCAIDGRTRQIRLIGFPMPDNFPEERYEAAEYDNVIRDFYGSTKFTDMGKFNIGLMLTKLKELLIEDDGMLREDWKFESTAAAFADSFDGYNIMEQLVPVGAEVCAIGTYSAQKTGLVQDLSSGGLELHVGGAEATLRLLRGRAFWRGFLGLFFVLLGTLGSYFILKARENSPEIMQQHQESLLKALKEDDLTQVEAALNKGVSPNLSDGSSQLAIVDIKSEAMFKTLLANGFQLEALDNYGQTPLRAAMHAKRMDLVEWLLAAGADVNAKHPDWGTTPLEVAYDDGDLVLFERLERAGGAGEIVPKDEQYFKRNDEHGFLTVINQYVAGLDASAAANVRELTDNWPEDFFESLGRGLYAGARGSSRTFAGALVQNNLATVFVITQPHREFYVYALKRVGDAWKIRREGIDDNGTWKEFIKSARQSSKARIVGE